MILEGAKRVVAEKGPDGASLAAIANEVGVSHSLVVHYFGSYDALVEEVIGEQLTRIKKELIAHGLNTGAGGAETLVESLFTVLRSPGMGRTLGWELLTRRAKGMGKEDLTDPNSNICQLRDIMTKCISSNSGEEMLVLVFSVVIGYSLSADVLWPAVGRERDDTVDGRVRQRLVELVRSLLKSEESGTEQQKEHIVVASAPRTDEPSAYVS